MIGSRRLLFIIQHAAGDYKLIIRFCYFRLFQGGHMIPKVFLKSCTNVFFFMKFCQLSQVALLLLLLNSV